jgi:GntR family transcriptional regulator
MREDDGPAFRRIAGELREQIKAGYYRPGAPLPSVRRLQERYAVSPMTVRQAIQQLRAEGLVTVERGSGVFVRDQPQIVRVSGPSRFRRADRDLGQAAFAAEMERLQKEWRQDLLEVSQAPAPDEVSNRMGLEPGALVIRRYRRFHVDGLPHQVATSFIPLELAAGTAIEQENTGPGGTYRRLEEAGHPIARFEEEVSSRMPSPDERELLRIPEGVPLFRVLRFAYGSDDRVLELTESLYPSDRVVLAYPWDAA